MNDNRGTFLALASLFHPAEGGEAICREAPPDWNLEVPPDRDGDVFIWGRTPDVAFPGVTAALQRAFARERTLRALQRHPPTARPAVDVHRVRPPQWLAGATRDFSRAILMEGAVVSLASERYRRVFEAVVEDAGADAGRMRFRLSGDGSARARVLNRSSSPGEIRMARAGVAADPRRSVGALRRLAQADIPATPRLLGDGEIAGAAWCMESVLPGRRPRRLGSSLMSQVITFCSGLPRRDDETPSSATDRLREIAALVHGRDDIIRVLEECYRAGVKDLPAVMQHGDLWAGNLLVSRGRLTGIVDWDAWHPAGSPGSDLLHMLAAEDMTRYGLSIGGAILRRPWKDPRFAHDLERLYRLFDLKIDAVLMPVLVIEWWACRAAHGLRQVPGRAGDEAWVEENIDSPAKVIERLV